MGDISAAVQQHNQPGELNSIVMPATLLLSGPFCCILKLATLRFSSLSGDAVKAKRMLQQQYFHQILCTVLCAALPPVIAGFRRKDMAASAPADALKDQLCRPARKAPAIALQLHLQELGCGLSFSFVLQCEAADARSLVSCCPNLRGLSAPKLLG
jgi:hypothetical protein